MKRIALLVVALLLTSSGWLTCLADITAPTCVKAGELCVARSDVEATWTVYPGEYKSAVYVADEGRTCVFASPAEGKVTLIAASIVDNQIVISEHTIYNGVDVPNSPEDEPIPEPPPEPKPETLESVVTDDVVDGATAADYAALAESFEAAVSGIDRGTIQTPAGARETFRATWTRKAGEVNPSALTLFADLLTKLSDKVDKSSLDKIKEDYTIIVKALKSVSETIARNEKKSKEPQTKAPASTGGCPNGQCPVNQYQGWRFR